MAGDPFPSPVVGTMITGAEALLACESVARPFALNTVDSVAGGVVADSPSSSGIGGQYVLSTCFSAGRLIGFDRKKSIPQS